MVRPANVDHLVIRGTLPGGERWATGLWTPNNGTTAAEGLAALVAITSYGDLMTAIRGCLSSGSSLAGADLYHYDAAGPAPVASIANTTSGSGVGSAPGFLPNQTSVVMTLRSATLTRSGRGRMFVPATGLSVDASGLLVGTRVNTLRTALAAFLSAANGVIVSPTRTATYPIVSVDNDLIPDVIRARVDAMVSVRTSSPVT